MIPLLLVKNINDHAQTHVNLMHLYTSKYVRMSLCRTRFRLSLWVIALSPEKGGGLAQCRNVGIKSAVGRDGGRSLMRQASDNECIKITITPICPL